MRNIMGFFSKIKKLFSAEETKDSHVERSDITTSIKTAADAYKKEEAHTQELDEHIKSDEETTAQELLEERIHIEHESGLEEVTLSQEDIAAEEKSMLISLRKADKKLSAWLNVVLDGVQQRGDMLTRRLHFLLSSLNQRQDESKTFVDEFNAWLAKVDYKYIDEFRSELQYRLSLALELEDEEDEKDRLFLKLNNSLNKTREYFRSYIVSIFSKYAVLSDDFWSDLEDVLIMSDMGYQSAIDLITTLKKIAQTNGLADPQELLPYFSTEIEKLFTVPKRIEAINPPEIVLIVGINGVGKTTTIAKLAYRSKMQGKRVLVIGADTFRAAAIDQMKIWTDTIEVDFFSKTHGIDPAAVVYEGLDKALASNYDVIYIDTAGRLHTKAGLMDELSKIRGVVAKKHPGAPHRTGLVVDATTGQNAIQQAKIFSESTQVSEVIITKLDGTAKGGIAIALANLYKIPITFVGLGEKLEDLRPFDPKDFAKSLFTPAESA